MVFHRLQDCPVDSLAMLSYLGSLTTFPNRERLVVSLVQALRSPRPQWAPELWSHSGTAYLSRALLSCDLDLCEIPDSESSLQSIQQWGFHPPNQTTFMLSMFLTVPYPVLIYSTLEMRRLLDVGKIILTSARCNVNGHSALHMVAFMAGDAYCRSRTMISGSVDYGERYPEAYRLFKQLLQHGADLLLQNEFGYTPFSIFAAQGNPVDQLKGWVNLLASYDVSVLDKWIATEPEVYQNAHERWTVCGRRQIFDICHSTNDQNIASRIELRVTPVIWVHKLQRPSPPGAWTASWDVRIPDVICWEPSHEELEYGDVQVGNKYSVAARPSVTTVSNLSRRLESMCSDSYWVALRGSKDDTSQQALLFTRRQTCHDRRRSSSQPPSQKFGEKKYFGSRFTEAYLFGFLVHPCPYDSRRRICFEYRYDGRAEKPNVDVRSCCAGVGHPSDILDFDEERGLLPFSDRLGLQCMRCSPWNYGRGRSPKWKTREQAQTWRCERHETWASS